MDPSTDTAPTVASAPFDKPDANIILRSSDNIDFMTYKGILALASPVFEDMFSIPQPSPSANNIQSDRTLPTITVTEDSQTLHHLLRLCYPVAPPIFQTPAGVTEVLEAARKYQMEEVTSRMSQLLRSELSTFITDHPLNMYAIACRYGLESVARKAALKLNEYSDSERHIEYVPEMDHISAGALHRLLCLKTLLQRKRKAATFCPEAAVTAAPSAPILSHPFDHSSATSDIVLQSSDGVHFHVHSFMVSLSSPIFGEIINQRPNGNCHTPEGICIFTLTEHSRRLLIILQTCYPMSDPDIEAVGCTLSDVALAARTYRIARLTDFSKRKCLDLVKTDALRAYLIAMREGWEDLGKYAAKHAIFNSADIYLREMEDVPAKVYHRLLVYRHNSLNVLDPDKSLPSRVYCGMAWSSSTKFVVKGSYTPDGALRFCLLVVAAQLDGLIAPRMLYRNKDDWNAMDSSKELTEELRAAFAKIQF